MGVNVFNNPFSSVYLRRIFDCLLQGNAVVVVEVDGLFDRLRNLLSEFNDARLFLRLCFQSSLMSSIQFEFNKERSEIVLIQIKKK